MNGVPGTMRTSAGLLAQGIGLGLFQVAYTDLVTGRLPLRDRGVAGSLTMPYCGVNAGFEAARWLDDPASVASMAMVPLRTASGDTAFGLLVVGSPDPTRYSADMGTDFLMRMGEVASAALSRLRVGA